MKRIAILSTVCLGLLILCIIVIHAGIYFETKAYIYNDASQTPIAQVALIPGAGVLEDGSLSSILTDRVDTAINLYKIGKVSKILVSGDNSTVEYNEVNPVRLYLIDKDVRDEDIFLDHAGFDTYSTMYRARDIFSVSSILIVTQSFHLTRAVFIARYLGIDAYGVNADVGHMLFRNYVREIFANEKAVIDLAFSRKPKFLGNKISIVDEVGDKPTKTEQIHIDSPSPNQIIQSPLTITGEARGYWFFEASFPIDVVDWDGRIIGTGYATADGEWMTEDFVQFTGTIHYDLPSDIPYARGTIIFKKDNPSGLPENDGAFEIPIVFESVKNDDTGIR